MNQELKQKLIGLLEDEAVSDLEDVVNRGGGGNKFKMAQVVKLVDKFREDMSDLIQSERTPNCIPAQVKEDKGKQTWPDPTDNGECTRASQTGENYGAQPI